MKCLGLKRFHCKQISIFFQTLFLNGSRGQYKPLGCAHAIGFLDIENAFGKAFFNPQFWKCVKCLKLKGSNCFSKGFTIKVVFMDKFQFFSVSLGMCLCLQ